MLRSSIISIFFICLVSFFYTTNFGQAYTTRSEQTLISSRIHSVVSRWQPAQYALVAILALFIVTIPFGTFKVIQKSNFAGATASYEAGFDLHPYWYYAHFLWQGENPYKALIKRASPILPVDYLDGVRVTDGPVYVSGLGKRAPNTATIMLIVAPLARFSWFTAKSIWLISNYLFLLGSSWLLLKLLPSTQLTQLHKTVILLLGLSLWSSRFGLLVGQTVFIVFICLVGALYFRTTHPLIAGLLLGLALSKYSIAIVAVILLLFEQRWLIVAIGGMVQIVATWLMTLFNDSSFLDTVGTYIVLASDHITEGSINLNQAIDSTHQLGSAIILLSVLGFIVIAWVQKRDLPLTILRHRLVSFHLLVIFSLWSLLTLYHLDYDMMIAQSVIILLIYGLSNQIWQLSPRQERGLWGIVVGSVALISCPDKVMIPLLIFFSSLPIQFPWELLRTTFWMAAMLILIIWLFWQLKPITNFQYTHQLQEKNSNYVKL